MDGLKAILTTLGIVFAALGIALIALVVVWLVSNYSVGRLLDTVGVFLTAVGLASMLIIHFRHRR